MRYMSWLALNRGIVANGRRFREKFRVSTSEIRSAGPSVGTLPRDANLGRATKAGHSVAMLAPFDFAQGRRDANAHRIPTPTRGARRGPRKFAIRKSEVADSRSLEAPSNNWSSRLKIWNRGARVSGGPGSERRLVLSARAANGRNVGSIALPSPAQTDPSCSPPMCVSISSATLPAASERAAKTSHASMTCCEFFRRPKFSYDTKQDLASSL